MKSNQARELWLEPRKLAWAVARAKEASLSRGSSQILNFNEPESWLVINELHKLAKKAKKLVSPNLILMNIKSDFGYS